MISHHDTRYVITDDLINPFNFIVQLKILESCFFFIELKLHPINFLNKLIKKKYKTKKFRKFGNLANFIFVFVFLANF